MENKYIIFYGCYQGNYEKMYKWQCKAFNNPHDATQYTLDNNISSGPSLLLDVNKNIPNIFHSFIVQKKIKQMTKVDIN